MGSCAIQFSNGLHVALQGRSNVEHLPGNFEAAASLRHPNLVAMLGTTCDKSSGTEYVVMEPVALGSLLDVINDEVIGTKDEATVVNILVDIVAGIRYMHSVKVPVVHCDIRAKNVLLDEKLTAKVSCR